MSRANKRRARSLRLRAPIVTQGEIEPMVECLAYAIEAGGGDPAPWLPRLRRAVEQLNYRPGSAVLRSHVVAQAGGDVLAVMAAAVPDTQGRRASVAVLRELAGQGKAAA